MEICCSCNSPIQAIRALTGDSQVDRLSQEKSFLQVFQRELLEETGLNLIGTPTIAFVLQVLRETEEGIQEWLACHFACEVAGRLSPQDPDGLVLSAHWVEEQAALSTWGRTPDTIVSHYAAGSVEK